MLIRPYVPADFGALVALWDEAGILVAYNDPAEELPRLLLQRNCQMLLGEVAGDVIGSILVGHDGLRGWIYKLAIARSARGKGFGRELVRYAERWLLARGMPKCNLMVRAGNTDVVRFYERLGYVTAGHAVMGHWLAEGDVDMAPAELDVMLTYLEMTEAPVRPGPPLPKGNHALMRVENPSAAFYRYLYDTVGERSFWVDRRKMPDADLSAEITHPEVEIYVLYAGGQPAGFIELDRRPQPEIAIRYFGLMPGFGRRGLGRYLLHWAVERAWSYQPSRLVVETSSLDHPRVLGTYQRAGFIPFSQEQRRIPDPRLSGLIPAHLTPYASAAAADLPAAQTLAGTVPFPRRET